MSVDQKTLADLVEFARIEQQAHDLEPWAEVIAQLRQSGVLTREQSLWLVWLYNAYDSLQSAWRAYSIWSSPAAWARSPHTIQAEAAEFPIMRERRNLYGGRILHRYQSYTDLLAGDSQQGWLLGAIGPLHVRPVMPQDLREENWNRMLARTRKVWGVGRQASFEWTEFLTKVDPLMGKLMDAPDACLWESSGPRKCLERIYQVDNPTRNQLENLAWLCRDRLARDGVNLAWVDFETVICDFNVMRDGRYYPGRHIAALKEEVQGVPVLEEAFNAVIPDPWRTGIDAGVRKDLMSVYQRTGRIITP